MVRRRAYCRMRVGPRRVALMASVFSVGALSCTSAPDPTVAFLETAQSLPDSLDVGRPHSVQIRRVARTPEEHRALEAAERADPPRDSVLAAMRYRSQESAPTDPRLWWASGSAGVRWPYAITDAAVRYYLAVGRAFRAGDFREVGGQRMSSSSLRYIATTERRAEITVQERTFRDVYVVRLQLAWNEYCGTLCARNISAERTVIVSPVGEVLLIEGDGKAMGWVS
jgi:hypothetical protein